MSITNTAKNIWFNGDIIPWQDAKTHVMSHALHHGTSIFEGLRCYQTAAGKSVIFRHHDHMQRLLDSAKIYRFQLPYSKQDLMAACYSILKCNDLQSAYIRPLAFVGDVGLALTPPEDQPLDVMIAAFECGSYLGDSEQDEGIRVMVSSWNRPALNTIPAGAKAGGNYLSSALVGGEARRHGYDEGIALNTDGYLSEGAAQNIFIVKNGCVITPPLTSSILPGLTRDSILKLAADLAYPVKEENITREGLYLADEVFMTGTLSEIVAIKSVDNIEIGQGKVGPITAHLRETFFALIDGLIEDKYDWLDPVV